MVKNKIRKSLFEQGQSLSNEYKAKSDLIIQTSVLKENIQSVTVKVNDKDYSIDEKYFVKNKDKANAIFNMLDFGELIVKKHNGKSTYELTNKKKIKRDNP
mgnify:CR=1 FL=1